MGMKKGVESKKPGAFSSWSLRDTPPPGMSLSGGTAPSSFLFLKKVP